LIWRLDVAEAAPRCLETPCIPGARLRRLVARLTNQTSSASTVFTDLETLISPVYFLM
jgi:hypothetical protein